MVPQWLTLKKSNHPKTIQVKRPLENSNEHLSLNLSPNKTNEFGLFSLNQQIANDQYTYVCSIL